MEAATFISQSRITSPLFGHNHRRSRLSPRQFPVLAVFAKPAETVIGVGESVTVRKGGGYKDSWFDLIAINYLSKSVQDSTGFRNEKSGYESFVDAAASVYRNFNPIQQHQLVAHALDKAFPRPILSLIRILVPQSKFAREYFAAFTTIFFAWLVGPCEVRESELNGVIERNVVHVKKCRFLEETNCVGMCVNLCKIPSQAFIKDSLGTPVNMVPNFDDMSCEMIFGQNPPASNEDPALKQPCFKLCKERPKHSMDCSG